MTGAVLTAAPPAGAQRLSLRIVTGGEARDFVGWVLGTDGDHLVVLPADAGPQWVAKDTIEAKRTVGPRVVRPASTPFDLSRVAVHGWPGVERFRMGGWLLRAGAGWTSRANSCFVAGDPGLSTAEAVRAVVQFYRHRNLPPRLQITLDEAGAPIEETRSPGPTVAEVEAHVAEQGWQATADTLVLVRELRSQSAPELPASIRPVWADEPSSRWLSMLSDRVADHQVLPELTAAPARYLTLLDGSVPVAIGRGATAEDWLGLACLNVHPEYRGRGFGRLVTELLLADTAASFSYLQVNADNAPARALYESLGFVLHHRYRYRVQAD